MYNTHMKREIRFARPSLIGIDNLSNTIAKQFKFIGKRYYEAIYLFIKEVSEQHSIDHNNTKIITGFRFKVGEIEYFPKNGNLLLTVPDDHIENIRPILENHFPFFDIEKEREYDEYSIVTVELNF